LSCSCSFYSVAAVLSTGQVTSPCLQNLAFQILAMAKMQTVGNNEKTFVLASLKEFVKTWGTGGVGSFQLDCKYGQCMLSMEFNLGAPGSSILPRPKTTKTPQNVTSGVRILLHYNVTKSAPNKSAHRGQVPGLTVPIRFSTLSRNTSTQINTVMSPNTRQILPLVP
jgi:hypothetical protein